jgi:CHASE3 domain sensor protein
MSFPWLFHRISSEVASKKGTKFSEPELPTAHRMESFEADNLDAALVKAEAEAIFPAVCLCVILAILAAVLVFLYGYAASTSDAINELRERVSKIERKDDGR